MPNRTVFDIRNVFAQKAGIETLQIPNSMLYEDGDSGSGATQGFNNTAAIILADRLVYVSGVRTDATGSRVPEITLATNLDEPTRAVFVTLDDIAIGATGRIFKTGMSAANLNTTAGTVIGTPVYLTTAGGFSLTRPTGTDQIQEVGTVAFASATVGVVAWDLTTSEIEVHIHETDAEGGRLDLGRVGTVGSISADAAGRALFADDVFGAVEVSAAGAGGKFAANALTTAGIANLVADDAFSAVEVSTAGAGGKFAANALTTAGIANLIADDAFSAVEVSTAGAGGKFAANALTTAGIANLVADDAFTAVEVSTAGAGGKFAANALTTAGIANLVADDAFSAVEVSTAGAGGKFAANALTAAGVTNLIAAGAFTNANLLQVVPVGGFADSAATRALFADGVFDFDQKGLPVRNNSGAGFNAGDVVAINGWDEANTIMTIGLADNDAAALRGPLYVLRAALATATSGRAYKSFRLTAVNTAAAAAGSPVFLSAVGTTTNTWTLTAPTAANSRSVSVGRVAVSDAAIGVVEFNIADAQQFVIGNQDLQPGIISADVTGRALMADDFFTNAHFVAGAGGKFAANALDTVAIANTVADDAFTAVEVSTVGVGGKFAANALTTAGIANLVADDAFTAVEVSTAGVGGKFAANALTTAGIANLVADDAFTAVEVSTAGVGGKFAANALTTAGIVNLVADDAFTAAEFVAGVGGKFAANALVTAGIANLFADDAWTAVEVSTAGVGGKFAANALTTAGIANLVADDAFTAVEVSTVGVGGKFAANALTTAGIANLVADDAFTAVEVSTAGAGGKFAANALTTAGIVNLFADDSWTAVEVSTAGVGGKFAANALTAAGVTNLIALDAFTNANLLQVIPDGAFVADAATRALLADQYVSGAKIQNNGVATAQLALNTVQIATGTLTSAQLLALRATPIAVVAAGGANIVNEFVSATLFYDFGGVAYTITAAADDLAFRYTGAAGVIVSQTVDTAGLLDAAVDVMKHVGMLATDMVMANNAAIVAHNVGATEWTLGNGVVRYAIAYRQHATGF